jgi:pyruvate dehydrogenase E2 component (dihydrolipoamide acetyltransferase)
MEEGFLESWLCETGAEVALGQPICEVETEKLTVAVESPYAGILLRCIEPGSTIPVGEPIAVIGQPGEDTAAYHLYQPSGSQPASAPPGAGTPSLAAQPLADPPPAGPPGAGSEPATPGPAGAPAQHDHPSAAPGAAGAPASPLARRIAASLGVDLTTVTGTGPDGRITREDVERAAVQVGSTVSPPGEENPR